MGKCVELKRDIEVDKFYETDIEICSSIFSF
jgi:hypothetical protein